MKRIDIVLFALLVTIFSGWTALNGPLPTAMAAAQQDTIEQHYAATGPHAVQFVEYPAKTSIYRKYEVWFPADMVAGRRYPLIMMANGTGVRASRYKETFEHLASWGFIVAGNEDDNSRTGASTEETLQYVLALDADTTSPLYHHIDRAAIGIAGHSQGGVGAINAVTQQPSGPLYRAIWAVSTTSSFWGQLFGSEWCYDMSRLRIPAAMVAGTGLFDAGFAKDASANQGQGICPLWSLNENYAKIPAGVPKLMARRRERDHGQMLKASTGYMTAWFCYWLQKDKSAGKAFRGKSSELSRNPAWCDVRAQRH